MVWYSHLLKNFSQSVVIHTVKGFGIVNKSEVDVFPELSCFFDDPADVGNLISGSSGSVSVGSLLLSPGSWYIQGFVCALQESVSPCPVKFWWLYGRVNGDLLQDSLSHTQVCCTQSPCPCSRPLLTHTFAEDTQTQF